MYSWQLVDHCQTHPEIFCLFLDVFVKWPFYTYSLSYNLLETGDKKLAATCEAKEKLQTLGSVSILGCGLDQ